LALIIILTICYFIFFYSGFQIKNVVVSGNAKVKSEDLQALVWSNAHTGLISLWNIKISSSSIFLVDENKINKAILDKFPIIENVQVNKNLPQTVIIGIVERKPIGAFCTSTNQCFLIDNNGVAFEQLDIPPAGVTIVRQTAGDARIFTGEEIISQNIMTAISKIQRSLKDNFQIDLKEALITSPVRLNIKTSENWQIYFDLSAGYDIDAQLAKLNLLLDEGITAGTRDNLEYIDLRPNDRAIICDNATCGGRY